MNILFVCSLNKIRSLTAEQLFSGYPGLHAKSAGTQSNSRIKLNNKLIGWADKIFVMETHHREKICQEYSNQLDGKEIIVLDIPNGFEYMDSELIEMLKLTVHPHLFGSSVQLSSRIL